MKVESIGKKARTHHGESKGESLELKEKTKTHSKNADERSMLESTNEELNASIGSSSGRLSGNGCVKLALEISLESVEARSDGFGGWEFRGNGVGCF